MLALKSGKNNNPAIEKKENFLSCKVDRFNICRAKFILEHLWSALTPEHAEQITKDVLSALPPIQTSRDEHLQKFVSSSDLMPTNLIC